MKRSLYSLLAFVALLPARAQESSDVARLMRDPAVKAALEAAKANEQAIIEEQVRLSEIPAPGFKEGKRAAAVRQIFTELGLKNVQIDRAGNVLGERPGLAPRPNLVFAAHLDTVFPEGTDVKVTRQGSVLKAPGIGDDARGLAVVIGVIKALNQTKVLTPGTITFVADVGEEGLGDLRGMKQLFNDTLKGRIDRFVSVDGTGHGITNVGVGSYRYRVIFRGPGGHSYGAFGLANPIHALGRAIAKIADFKVPQRPKTTFSVGRIGGGTSVNSIAYEAWMEMDMRSADMEALGAVDAIFLKAVDQALTEENESWGNKGKLTADTQKVGERPAGNTPENSAIVQTAIAVTKALGLTPRLGEGSTDANLPMNLHIPAITIGGGGRGTGAHSLNETFDTADSWQGTQRALLLALALAQK
jgi:acetylornithine deacetylase/succinyl-diaminopimelate desuccinylase-like protein